MEPKIIKTGTILTFEGENIHDGEFRTTIVVEKIYLSNLMRDEYDAIIKYKATRVTEKHKTKHDKGEISLSSLNKQIIMYNPIIV